MLNRKPWKKLAVSRRLIINLKSGETIAGLLVREDGPLLVLAKSTLIDEKGLPTTIDGQSVVERSNISFAQLAPLEEI